MSLFVPTRGSQKSLERRAAFFWIPPVDSKGKPIDERLISGAYEKATDFLRYRARELRDEAVRANLVEQAVNASSVAARTEDFRDVKGYLFVAFKRLVDERIEKERRRDARIPDYYRSEGRLGRTAPNAEERVYNHELRDIIDLAIDKEMKWAWKQRMLGYTLEEIAPALKVSADTLSARMRRARDTARYLLFGRRQ